MLVQPVVIPGSGTLSWTVLGDDDMPVVPVERFLAYLTDIGRLPNAVKGYAHDMKDFWHFIGLRGLDWREARLEDVGRVRGVATASAGGPFRSCGGAAVGGAAGQRVDRQPERPPGPVRLDQGCRHHPGRYLTRED